MKKVLVIDDDEIFSKVLMDSLPKDKYEVAHALNGEEGLQQLDTNKPDIIILDLMMPKMDGFQFIEELKNRSESNLIPILVSSQLSKTEDMGEIVASGLEVGVKGYFIKSSQNIEMIIKTIEDTLEN